MTETQLAWRNECYGYFENGTPEQWAEYQQWLDSHPDEVNDSPPDNPEDNFPLPATDDEPPF
jgi:hypothetical protein